MKNLILCLIAYSSITNLYAAGKLKKCKVTVEVEVPKEENFDYNWCYDRDFDQATRNDSFITYETYKFANTTEKECENALNDLENQAVTIRKVVHRGDAIAVVEPDIYFCKGTITKIHKIKHGRKRLFKSEDYPFLF